MIRLLLLIYILAEINTEIPFPENGLRTLKHSIASTVHGVHPEEGDSVQDATRYLIDKARKIFQSKGLPENLRLLLKE